MLDGIDCFQSCLAVEIIRIHETHMSKMSQSNCTASDFSGPQYFYGTSPPDRSGCVDAMTGTHESASASASVIPFRNDGPQGASIPHQHWHASFLGGMAPHKA